MPIRARRFIRKMRGGAQSHLIEGDDGEFYIVKFLNNPQHRRILINEWLANAFLRYLQIFVPETAIVELTNSFLTENRDVNITLGSRRDPPLPGLHFGSRVAVHPDRVAIYDFLPDAVLGKIEYLAGHHPTYTTRQKDIDEQRAGFRRLISELTRVAQIKPKATAGLSADVTASPLGNGDASRQFDQ